ncbi:MAG: aminoacyl-tRNA hydrolase [Alphaproteobacteria bacterium]|nr:aminoacyl-tRNA hydrolase [Alphaproteobacteria bacterium]
MSHPYVLVGLGNPGDKYVLNRHNIGFLAIDAVAKYHDVPRYVEKFQGHLTALRLDGKDIFLFKPMTYMNLSGGPVAALMRFYKIPLNHLYVVHDDLALVPEKLKVKVGGGDGGHNGLKSIDQHMGAAYTRIRLGIGHPGHKDLVSHFVLTNFSKNDQNWLEPMLWTLGKTLPSLLGEDTAKWLNSYHLAVKELEKK